jgi:hypothetical protein
MEYMSDEHIAAMNTRLAGSQEVRALCSALPRPISLAIELSDGPGGETVHWTFTVTDAARFSRDPCPAADVSMTGDWTKMMLSSRALTTGQELDPEVDITGDLEALEQLLAIRNASAPSVAGMPVTFPDI